MDDQTTRDEIERLLIRHRPLIIYIISPIIGNESERDDCLAEVNLRVFESYSGFDPAKGSFNTWLTAIARNTALNHARKLSRNQTDEIPEDMPSDELPPDEKLIRKERSEALLRALSTLSGRDRLLFYRKYYDMQSTAQIAAELGTTERAVEGKLYRIKKKLRDILGGEGYEN